MRSLRLVILADVPHFSAQWRVGTLMSCVYFWTAVRMLHVTTTKILSASWNRNLAVVLSLDHDAGPHVHDNSRDTGFSDGQRGALGFVGY